MGAAEGKTSYEKQLEVFRSFGYEFSEGITKEHVLDFVYEFTWEDEVEEHIEKNPFSLLYFVFGARGAEAKNYNYSKNCIWFDLEFFDPNSQYKWFMERMGEITQGEINFTDIKIETDSEKWEWISFKVNGVPKKWKLERAGYIADHFVQRFSYLPKELGAAGRYTYYDNGGQQWVIDYATKIEQEDFIGKTGLGRILLGEGNQFSDSKE